MDDLEEQKDVDLAIFDFITYKALDAIFEWRASPNYHESDLPDVLVEMTNGMRLNTPLPTCFADLLQTGYLSWNTSMDSMEKTTSTCQQGSVRGYSSFA